MGKKVPKGWIKLSEFEALTGLNNRTVTLAIKRGSIPAEFCKRIGEGKTSPVYISPQSAAVHWYNHVNANHHLTQPLRAKLAGYIRTFNPAAVDEVADEVAESQPEGEVSIKKGNEGGGDNMTFAEAQRRKEVAKAKTAELEFMEKEGALILKQQVQDQLFSAGKEIRNALLSVPDRITDQVIASVENRTQVNNIIYDAIAAELEKLADLVIE